MTTRQPSKQLHVAVDFDDVLLEFVPSLFRSFELEFGITLPYDGDPWGADSVAFRDGKNHSVWRECGYDNWWGWLRDRDWLWATFPAVPGAIGGIKRLRQLGCRVEGLTKKPQWAEHTVWRWCGRWRPDFQTVTVVPSSEAKVLWSDAHVLVDDALTNVQDFADDGRYGILFDRAELHKDKQAGRLFVAHSWGDVVKQVAWLKEALA